MIQRTGVGAAALVVMGALAVGCSEDGDTVLSGGGLTTDAFPGNQIQDNNVADDGRAFTNQGQDLEDLLDLRFYWNVANGDAIALYELRSAAVANVLFYAAYFDGVRWGAPVQLRGGAGGSLEDSSERAAGFKLVFLNTATSPVPEVARRDGDAVILIARRDLPANLPTSEEDANVRLWMTYFDRSAAHSAASGTIVGGFDTAAITVDQDNLTTGADDASVSTFGFVSSSLVGAHQFTGGIDGVDSGQPTDFVGIVYRKDPGTGTQLGDRYLTRPLVGDAPGNDLASLLAAEEVLTPGVGAFATGDSVGAVDTLVDFFTVSEDLLFWQSSIGVVSSNTIERSVTVTRFDADGPTGRINLGPAPRANEQDDVVDVPRAAHVYGGDHGLASTDVIFTTTGFRTDNAPTTGDTDGDRDLYVARIDGEDATLARELVQIDAFPDTIALTDPQQVGRDIANEATRINRTGQFITVLFNQASTDAATDGAGAALHVNEQLYVQVIQTRRRDPDPVTGLTPARTLADSVFDLTAGATIFEPRRAPAAVASGLDTGTGDEPDVSAGDFQLELAGGQASANFGVTAFGLGCAIQSNSNRVNFLYRQVVDLAGSGTNTDEERLLVNGIEVALGATATDPPTFVLTSTAEDVVASRDTDYGQEFAAFAMDAGDETRDALGAPSGDSGRSLVFFVRNQNNPTDDAAAGAFTETRAFVWDGATALLSTDDAREFGQVDVFRRVTAVTVVQNEDIVGSPHHAGDTIHFHFIEFVQGGPAGRLVTRSYDKKALNDGDPTNDALEDRFTPNLVGGTAPDDPVQIDLITDGPLLTLGGGVGIVPLTAGRTVGVYFDEDEHLYYTETSGTALDYPRPAGEPDPELIDDDSPVGTRGLAWNVTSRSACDALPKSTVYFTRDDASQSGLGASGQATRAYIRVHD